MRCVVPSLTAKRFFLFSKKPLQFNATFIDQHYQQQQQLCRFIQCSCHGFLVGKNPIALAKALSFSGNLRSLILGTQMHDYALKLGFANDVFTQNNLIKMYSRNGLLSDGFKVFDEMSQRNVVSWTLLISGAIENGELELGLEMFLDMTRNGLIPNEFALGSVMKACAHMEVGELGMCIHCFALKIGMERNPFVGSSILSFYAKLRDIEAAESMFKYMAVVDVGCWNAMIAGYAQCGYGFEAVRMASVMQCQGIMMDKYSLISALQGCSLVGHLNFGRQIHGFIVRSEVGFSASVMNALIDMYFKNGAVDSALKIFERMGDRDAVTWNTVFGSFSHYEDMREVVSLFHEFMLTGMRPNHVTFSVLFRQCGELHDLALGLQFFCLALHFGFLHEANVTSSLINMFSRCGAMAMACTVFDSVVFKNIIIWNELILGYYLNCHDTEALETFCNLLQLGNKANEFTFSSVLEICCRSNNQQISRQIHGFVVKSGFALYGYVCGSLIKGYIKFGMLDDSFKVFNELERLDTESWGSMISALAREGYVYEANSYFISMIESGGKPDEFILGSILNCCAGIEAYLQTKCVHPFVIKLGFETHVFVACAVLDAYSKCGDITSARMAFDQSFESNDIIIYNAMIMAYAHHGLVVEATNIFDRIKLTSLRPSQATFVSIISACGHAGFVDQGLFLFESMDREYGLKPSPNNYGCLVDMMSRNGYLEYAKCIIEIMPYPPWPAILRSLLSGCRMYGNRKLGEWAARNLLQLVPENDAAYALLFKVYSEGGSWEDAAKVRGAMIERGLKKDPGHSWIEA